MEVGWGLLGLERKVTSPNNFKMKNFVGGVVRHDGQYEKNIKSQGIGMGLPDMPFVLRSCFWLSSLNLKKGLL